MRFHLGNVGILVSDTTHTLGVNTTNQVVVVTLVPVEDKVDAVVVETKVNTHVKLMFLLVSKLGVSDIAQVEVHLSIFGLQAPGFVRIVNWQCVRNAAGTCIGSQ